MSLFPREFAFPLAIHIKHRFCPLHQAAKAAELEGDKTEKEGGVDGEMAIPAVEAEEEEEEEEEEKSVGGFFSKDEEFDTEPGFVDEVRLPACPQRAVRRWCGLLVCDCRCWFERGAWGAFVSLSRPYAVVRSS